MSILNRLGILRAAARGFGFFARQGEEGARASRRILPARRADKKGETYGFPLLANHPLSLRRATGAVYRSPAKRLPPTCYCDRQGLVATPEGQGFPFLLLLKSGQQDFGATHFCARQRALICGSKCRKSLGRRFCICFHLQGKGVIRKRGETFGVSPLVRRAAQAHTPRRPQAAQSPFRLVRRKKHRISLMRCFFFSFSGSGSAPGCGRRGE